MTNAENLCLWCDEPLGDEGHGKLPSLVTRDTLELCGMHRECNVRQLVGSVGHQRGVCSCHKIGETEGDPPGMSRREAARAAALYAVMRLPVECD